MKKFKFRLESVLKIRQMKAEEELRNLSKIAGSINKLQNEILNNDKEASQSINQFQTSVGQDINYIRIFDAYLKRLSLQNDNLNKQIMEQQGALSESRKKVIEAKKEAEVLEIIKTKQFTEYYNTYLKREKAEEEERNNNLYISKQKEAENEKFHQESKSIAESEHTTKSSKSERDKTEYEKLQEYVDTYFQK